MYMNICIIYTTHINNPLFQLGYTYVQLNQNSSRPIDSLDSRFPDCPLGTLKKKLKSGQDMQGGAPLALKRF